MGGDRLQQHVPVSNLSIRQTVSAEARTRRVLKAARRPSHHSSSSSAASEPAWGQPREAAE